MQLTAELSGGASGVRGYVTATNPGSDSAGVYGLNQGATSSGYGIRGVHSGTGTGVFGTGHFGVSGKANNDGGYGGLFAGSGGFGSGNALLVAGDSHLLGFTGIGTTNVSSGVRLAVDGKVLCEEVEVQLSQDWPDYVFEDDYALTPAAISSLKSGCATPRRRVSRHLCRPAGLDKNRDPGSHTATWSPGR